MITVITVQMNCDCGKDSETDTNLDVNKRVKPVSAAVICIKVR